MSAVIEPAEPEFTPDGEAFSSVYGDRFASAQGAIAQARHVFLGGNDLPARWRGRRQFVILETGFGLGNNFLAAWDAWRHDAARPFRLHVVSIERHPMHGASFSRLAPLEAGLQSLREQLAQAWPEHIEGVHRLAFDDDRVTLTLVLGDVLDSARHLHLGVDAFFLDGFAPGKNPRMWQPEVMKALAAVARPGATLATYTAARMVRDALALAGFEAHRVPGFGPKRHMLRGQLDPARRRRSLPPLPYAGERDAVVIGAGLAGSACADALARRGWQVRLFDRAGVIAPDASGLPSGLLHPWLARDDNLAARLSRSGFLYALRRLRALSAAAPAQSPGPPWWQATGVFHACDSRAEWQSLAALIRQRAWPASFAQAMTRDEAVAVLGVRPGADGIWFAGAPLVNAGRWCAAMVQSDPQRIRLESGCILALEPIDGGWRLQLTDGRAVEVPVVVIANARAARALWPMPEAELTGLSGCLSLFPADTFAPLRAGLSADGYVIPGLLGQAAVGATYDRDADNGELASLDVAAAHEANGDRAQAALGQAAGRRPVGHFTGSRCASRDRQPLAGRLVQATPAELADLARSGAHLADLPRHTNLASLVALGSRGLSLAPLLGEWVGSDLEGEPAPLFKDQIASVDPARFALRTARRIPASAAVPQPASGKDVG